MQHKLEPWPGARQPIDFYAEARKPKRTYRIMGSFGYYYLASLTVEEVRWMVYCQPHMDIMLVKEKSK